MSLPARLLGFAFANADLLFEIDRDGKIVFVTGAASDFVQKEDKTLDGKQAGALFQPSEAAKFATFTRALTKGERAGPFKLKLVHGDQALVSMFRLAENGNNVSCTLTKPGTRGSFGGGGKDSKTNLPDKDSFLSAAALMAGKSDALTLIDVPGLPDLCAQLPTEGAEALMQKIGVALQGDSKVAGRLSDTSFGAISDSAKGAPNFAGRIRDVLSASGLKAGMIEQAVLSMKADDLSGEQKMLALRYVVDRFSSGQEIQTCGSDISASFSAMLDDTHARLKKVTADLAQGAFNFAFQPIVDLKSGDVSHYEALTRFPKSSEGIQEQVKFVEALGLANAMDLAVATKIIATLEAEPRKDVHFAFNISGHTISDPTSFGLFAGIMARKRNLAPRLLIEITETAEIVDPVAAGKAIAGLRAMGFRVGLDDFGAGAASLNYLHAFHVDFVKFDGALVKKIGVSPREDTLLKGLIKLCVELGVHTVAEYIEDEKVCKAATDMGFDYGQGYHFGKPEAHLLPPAPKAGKRKGESVSWG